MSLTTYHRKRDFQKTKEPYGQSHQKKEHRFLYVIQKHAASHLHYDFRIELDGVLKSWAVPKGPSLDPKIKHLAMHVEDHPIEYANFEGVIPKGQYGGGTVMVWDTGYWEPLDKNVKQAFYKGDLNFILHGKKLHGRWKLIRLKSKDERPGKDPWLLFKVNDEYSRNEQEYNITKVEVNSAQSDRTMEQIAEQKKRIWTKHGEKKSATKKRKSALNLSKVKGAYKQALPDFIAPELATLVTEPPKDKLWLHEIKWDGYRLLAHCTKNKVTLLTRHNKDWTDRFPTLVEALTVFKLKDTIIDGEVIALDNKKQANFQVLQNSMEEINSDVSLIYYVFDILYLNGYNLMEVPLITRKQILKQLLANKGESAIVGFNDHIVGNGEQIFKQACEYNLEGIVSKKINSAYSQKRTRDWLKIKCNLRQEFVIGGYTDPKSSRKYFGALLVGYYDSQKNLIYCGKVGTGFSQASLKEIATQLQKYEQSKCPFHSFPERVTKSIHWLKPKLVAEVEYLEKTSDGILRHPSFKGLRQDKQAAKVFLESKQKVVQTNQAIEIAGVKFTNLNRILYPEQRITKQDLVDYYQLVASRMLPHIINRPLTLVRCPTGNHKKCFYQKHFNENVSPAIKSIPILEKDHYESYIYIDNLQGLLSLVQMGVLEIHPWGSNIKNVEQPDRVIFDLDPAPEVAWKDVIQCAFNLHEFLNFLNLKNFVKTTGGKGLHIVIPIKPTITWDELRNVTKRIVDLMVETNPTKYIGTMSKAKRKGKIFIDYLRNARGATAVAPFSTRARSDAPIAMPLAWDELSVKVKSDSFTISNINKRLKQLKTDPWEDFFKTKQAITAKIRKKIGLE